MSTFPRTLPPRTSAIPRVPTGLQSLGASGKAQLRSVTQIGRLWEEAWPDLKVGDTDVESLLAWISWAFSTQEIFDITHPALAGSGKSPNGAGGGTPVISGASQTGEDIDTSGWSTGVTGVVKAGDVLRIVGLNQLFQVIADADSDGSGLATISLNPPIVSGSSPANGAGITRSGCVIRATIWDYTQPDAGIADFISGLRVTFREMV